MDLRATARCSGARLRPATAALSIAHRQPPAHGYLDTLSRSIGNSGAEQEI
jgi:hypothetical protein